MIKLHLVFSQSTIVKQDQQLTHLLNTIKFSTFHQVNVIEVSLIGAICDQIVVDFGQNNKHLIDQIVGIHQVTYLCQKPLH